MSSDDGDNQRLNVFYPLRYNHFYDTDSKMKEKKLLEECKSEGANRRNHQISAKTTDDDTCVRRQKMI